MKCAKCSAEVTVADSRCPKCNNDLLAFGATVFYEKSKHTSDTSSPATGMVFGAVANEFKAGLSGFNFDEKKIFSPALQMLKKVFSRHLSEEEIEKVFTAEVLPAVDDLSKDSDNDDLFQKIESAIRKNLGEAVYEHYKSKGADVLRILRAGELANELMDKEKGDYDLSIRMFPYFKASERASDYHASNRLKNLIKHPKTVELDSIVKGEEDNVWGQDIPEWLEGNRQKNIKGHRGAVKGLLNLLLKDSPNRKNLVNSRNAGLGIYFFGRDSLEMRNTRINMNNVFDANGSLSERENLARNLCELQDMRNSRMHRDVETDAQLVNDCRNLSYMGLRGIPEMMRI